jgi:hypothetical protein
MISDEDLLRNLRSEEGTWCVVVWRRVMVWSEDETVIVGECGCGFNNYLY